MPAALEDVADQLALGRLERVELEQLGEADPLARRTVFAEAVEVGLGTALELTAVRAAVEAAADLPEDAYLSVNVSPVTAVTPELDAIIGRDQAVRLVLEITEHAAVSDYEDLVVRLGHLRRRGVRVAVDDTGAGFASLQHILRLRPDVIKLDMALTRGVDADPVRRSLGAALVSFGQELHAHVVAEGVETASELDTLRMLGIRYGQGFHLGRPAPAATYAGDGRRYVEVARA